MTQSIVVQVGQCGNQVGCCFWDLTLREHAHVNQMGVHDEALSSFFRNVDQRGADSTGGKITALKARCLYFTLMGKYIKRAARLQDTAAKDAVLVDMEEGVLGEILQGPLRSLFSSTQLISDVSGSGNNWKDGRLACVQSLLCHSHSLLALANKTCVKSTFFEMRERFVKLYCRKAHLHHYLAVDGMELAGFNEAMSSLSDLIEEYTHLESPLMPNTPRLTIAN